MRWGVAGRVGRGTAEAWRHGGGRCAVACTHPVAHPLLPPPLSPPPPRAALGHPQSVTNSLWLMGNAMIASAREIISNHVRIANSTAFDFGLNRDWQYINLNGGCAHTRVRPAASIMSCCNWRDGLAISCSTVCMAA